MKIGRVYKIINSQTPDVYIGSTFNQLYARWQGHRSTYKSWTEGRRRENISLYYIIREIGDISLFKIMLIEEIEVENKRQLLEREQYYIDQYNQMGCLINKQRAFISDEESKQCSHNWYIDNKEKVLKRVSENYVNNREEKIKYACEYQIKYREKQKKTGKDKMYCDICHCEVSISNNSRHNKSKKHQSNLLLK